MKRSRIDLGGEVYKERVTAFELDCNICGDWLEWSSSCTTSLASL